MNVPIESRFGRALYEALPEVYRTRDATREGEGHLALYLDSCGKLLDTIYNSLDQRYKDCFPETCQEWLLPYFAQLVGTTTLSPHIEGKRREIMHAVAWRQGKGSLTTARDIAEKIGSFENLEIREGWKRVARTACVNGPFVSPESVDLREKSPQSFAGHHNQAPHCVDVRKPNWLQGHANPQAVLLYAPPFPGFFEEKNTVSFEWKTAETNGSVDIDSWFKKGEIPASEFMGIEYDGETWFFYKKTGVTKNIHITGKKTLETSPEYSFKEIKEDPKTVIRYRFSEINLDDRLAVPTGTYLVLEKLAARNIHIHNGITDTPISGLIANDCLLHEVHAPNSPVRLVYCTVLDEITAGHLDASDCIFVDTLYKKFNLPPDTIRYSRHGNEPVFSHIVGNTMEIPVFYTWEWGKPGCGVLHPVSPKAICHGAEDGGEMGAFHHRAYASVWDAVIEKLNDYLSAGMSATLIPDEPLLHGHVHIHVQPHPLPQPILPYAPPHPGFFNDENVVTFEWATKTRNGRDDINSWFNEKKWLIPPSEFMGLEYDGETWFFYKKPGVTETIHITGNKRLESAARYRFSKINLDGRLVVLTGTYLELEKLAARNIHIHNDDTNTPLSGLIANDCLFQKVHAPNSLMRLTYCTVLGKMYAELLEARDCIFMEILYKNRHRRFSPPGAIRYSRHSNEPAFVHIAGNTTETPVFYTQEWGKPGCGVLHPTSPEAIRHGAEGGGEMGAFHQIDWRWG
ncbi:MAG: hypothetical protein LBE22_01900 [Azoarcus sp.]|jgi:hypothetical protein|nr:hypothetical protein [Azoarcus sp.]